MSSHSLLYQPPPDTGLDLLHQDQDLLVLNKPSGLLSVPGRGPDKQDSLALRVQAVYPEARIVHRLDLETSGVMVMALHPAAHRHLSLQFERRRVIKHYDAIVGGRVNHEEGLIELPLITDWPNRPRQKIDFASGRPALTRYRLLHRDPAGDRSRLLLMPVTGRSHQLRVHLSHLGHPILGDSLYAPSGLRDAAPRLLLHARELRFEHPTTGRELHIRKPAGF